MGTEWQKSAHPGPNPATHRETELEIARIASRQKQLISLRQLEGAGLSPRGVSNRAARGRLFRIYDGIFALHPPPYSPHQRHLAAVGACGRHSAISDLAAAWLLGQTEAVPSMIHVSNRSGAGRGLPGVFVHRRAIDPLDIAKRHGIPCTTPARTVLDCAGSLGIEELEELLMAADSGRPGLDRRRLEALVASSAGRRGIRNLRELIADDAKETQVENERRMLRICRRFGLPEPEAQYEIRAESRTFYADFCWPELGLIVECDSWRWHGGKLKSERDRERDHLLTIAGWRVIHFTRNQIRHEAEATGRKLVALTTLGAR